MREALELSPTGPGRWWRRKIRIDDLGVTIGRDRLVWPAVAYYLYNDGLLLYAKGNRHYFLISTNYDRWEDACELVIGELHRRFAGRDDFAPFTLLPDGLAIDLDGDDRELRFSEIDHLELIKGMLLVWVKGTNFPAVGAPLARVRNGLLLLDKLIERGIKVISSSPLWVPRATPHVASVVSAAVGLPKAKLRR